MNLKNLNVLLAEDDVDDGEFICEVFSKNSNIENVEWVKNGQELVDFLIKKSNKKPDVILTDINMPILNGIEALEEINKYPSLSVIPVFVYSSSINPIYEKKCKELGALSYLIKPFDLNMFGEVPNQIINILKEKNRILHSS